MSIIHACLVKDHHRWNFNSSKGDIKKCVKFRILLNLPHHHSHHSFCQTPCHIIFVHSAIERLGDFLLLYQITKNVNPLIIKDIFEVMVMIMTVVLIKGIFDL